MRMLAVLVVSTCGLSGAALAQQPGVQLPAPPVTLMPPAPPPAPVPSVVTPSAPLPGVTFQSGPTQVPGGSITPSYRLKASKSSYRSRCKRRPGHRCRTS
jgi:hypothetical protein